MEKLVSVIVPIYNVEKYIECCVRSIMCQTYSNLEIILVDDGSTDDCGSILDTLKEEDSRIVIIHKKNEGVSAARNDGLKIASGEFVIFVDGDDWIDERLVQDFVKVIEKLETDVVLSYNYLIDDNLPHIKQNDAKKISSSKAIEQLYLGRTGVAVWNKIYKRSFLKDNNIAFHTQYWFAEGMTFNIECFSKCDSIGACNLERYHYVTNNESAIRKFNLNSWHCGLNAMEYQLTLLNPNDKKVINAWNWHYRQYNASILWGLYRSGQYKQEKGEVAKCARNLRKNISYPLKVDIGMKAKIKSMIFSIMPIAATKIFIFKDKHNKKSN